MCKDSNEKMVNFTPVKLETGEFLMTCEDITERTNMEENLTKAYQATLDITDNAPFGISLVDKEGRVEYINNALLEISGTTREQMLSTNPLNLPTYKELGLAEKMKEGLQGNPFRAEAVRYTSHFGKKETIRNFIGIPLEQKGERKLLMIIEDITKQKKLEEELQALSLRDELTGLYNRRGFFALGEQQLKIADRMQKDVLLVFTDLDRLKWINDNLGHEEGDRALVASSGILKETFRESDIIARIGGDEFVLLAIETLENMSQSINSRLQDKIDQYNAGTKLDYELSISTGIARYDYENPVSLDALIALADKLMYEDKKRKNRSSIYEH
jgi:diguanylate cyclase (GGDEF)-like protein/PAS domain S-box-containing protein